MTDKHANRFVLGIEIYEVSRTTRRHFDRRARALGFNQGQWRALLKLDRNEGISQAGLADLLDMQPISLGRILDRMVAADLVQRQPDPNDRRAVKLFLTPQAGPVLKVLHEIADELRDQASKGLTNEDQETALRVMRQMRSNLDALDNEATPTKISHARA